MHSLQRRQLFKKSLAIIATGAFLLFLLRIFSPNSLGPTRDFFAPLLGTSFNIAKFFSSFGGDEVLKLQDENTKLSSQNSILEARIRELEGGIINILPSSATKKSTSLVLSQAPASSYDTLVLSRDSGQMVDVGNRVIAYSGIYLGEVTEVSKKTLLVRLISYPGLETEAWLESSKLNITLTGEGGYNLKFTVPKNISVEVGDKILSNTNPQMLIGEVERVYEKPTEPLKEVWLRFGFNFRNLRYVELVN